MTCEKYRNVLIDAAAGEPVDGGLADHLEDCTPCRSTLEREQDLFTAIDDALRARMSERPQAGILAGVHAQITHEAQKQDAHKQSGWNPIWALAGAAALALVLVAMSHPWADVRKHPVEAGNLEAPALRVPESPAETQSARGSAENLGMREQARLHSAQPLIAEQPATLEPEILVPPDEAQAFAQFVARVAGRDEIAKAFVSPAVDGNDELPEIPPVEIAHLQLQPLVWEKWK